MTNTEFIAKRKEEELKEKFKNNITEIKALVGDSNFKKLPLSFDVETTISNSWDGDHYFSVNLNSGKIAQECSVAFVSNILLPDATFNKFFYDYCIKQRIF